MHDLRPLERAGFFLPREAFSEVGFLLECACDTGEDKKLDFGSSERARYRN